MPNIHFTVVNVIIGLVVGFTVNKYGFGIRMAVFLGVVLAIISSAISIPILIILSEGDIAKTLDFTIQYLMTKGMNLETAIVLGTLLSTLLDKILSCLIVAIFYRKKVYKNSIIGYCTIIKNVFNEKMKYDIIIFVLGIIVNIVFTYIVLILKIPFLFMDSIGTILTAVIIGPIAGAVVGIFTNIIFSFSIDYLNIHFSIVNAIIGLSAGFIAKKYSFNIKIALISGIIIGIISGLISIPISILLTNGTTSGTIDVFIQDLLNSGKSLIISTSIITLSTAILDKLLSCILVSIAVKKVYFFRINEK
ncbi:hypothetical protein [Brachyspira alvinipulli]|uniref:hypothetical protein n=1 Tax=Brachyspira alvinipulli TaxID=84379 RepID=UPI00316AD2D9